MADIAIEVENLWKQYRLGAINHGTLRRDMQSWWARLRGREDPNRAIGKRSRSAPCSLDSEPEDRFWALQNVSFSVKQGEVVGIIGRNGAGKSTLLKILSQITTPTRGEVRIRGRVASLLEVGTGFHPELSGRENVFLNGAILGMSKAEVRRKLDEIIAFTEIERFIDTPVKRYSSGMYVRLAFAVAAHLEPEILVVDEVLAVGDAAFQKKCLGKMDAVGREGRTVLFVSHNLQAVRALCQRGILLAGGELRTDAEVGKTLSVYNEQLQQVDFGPGTEVGNERNRRGSGAVRFTKIRVENVAGVESSCFPVGSTIRFHFSYAVNVSVDHLLASVALKCTKTGEIITTAKHVVSSTPQSVGHAGSFVVEFDRVNLRPKEYLLYFWLGSRFFQAYDVVDDIFGPLTITTDRDEEMLGYTLAEVPGYFDINSRIVEN